jgi:hypothetical protein
VNDLGRVAAAFTAGLVLGIAIAHASSVHEAHRMAACKEAIVARLNELLIHEVCAARHP